MIKAYKQDVKTNYILKEPNRSYAYFALFQALGNTLIFNPRSDKDDIASSLPSLPPGTPTIPVLSVVPTCITSPLRG